MIGSITLISRPRMPRSRKDQFSLHLSFLCFSLIDYFGYSVSNDSSCPLRFFPRKTRSNANFERGLQLPSYILWCRVDGAWHAVKSSDKHSIRQRLWYKSAFRIMSQADSCLKNSLHPQPLAKGALDRSYVASLSQQPPASAPAP